MSWALFARTLAWNRTRLLILMLVAFGWSMLVPVFYTSFSEAVREIVNSGLFPRDLLSFGSGDFFTLAGALTLGLQHPLAIAFVAVFAIGSPVAAIAGERERGTLEVLLSRPISRHRHYAVVALAVLVLVALVVAALVLGQLAGVWAVGVTEELEMARLPLVFANGVLLWAAFGSFSLAASVSSDRAGPALGLSLGYLLLNYFFEILGSLWDAAEWTQDYSLFHHFQPGELLSGEADPLDFAILAAAMVVPIAWALVVYPRRDLAAPA
ncbi:MAG TPA: ABC transporter permease subunit [Candidatus Limnocylindria bacterium]